jgi:hypothetical protein
MFKDSPSSAKMAGVLVLGALATLVFLHKGFAGIDVQLG